MSEKKEAGLNGADAQVTIANRIIENDGCGGEWCTDLKGTECPLFASYRGCTTNDSIVRGMKEWLDKYYQQKAEKRKAEAVKKEEQETKQEPARICGNCKYIHEVEKSENMTAQCDMKNSMVPILFDRCPDFEPRAASDQSGSSSSEGGVDAAAYAERITQLEKQNTRLAEEVIGYRAATRRMPEICEVIITNIDQVAKEREELQNQLNLAQEDALWIGKENSNLQSRCELLAGQRNRLASNLTKAMCRVKEVEQENAELRSKYNHPWKFIPRLLIEDGVVTGKITFL